MLTLVHAPQSRSSRILWLLEELGAEYEVIYVEIERRDGTGRQDPKNPHPDKKVPALLHDGVTITESTAIALYLTDMHPHAGLGPRINDAKRGTYLTWLSYYGGVIEPVMTLAMAGVGDNEAVRRAFRGREQIDTRIREALKMGPYLIGEQFTAADILLTSMGLWSRELLPAGEEIDSYIARCTKRPALERAQKQDAEA